jgi:AraC family transcriptional regulator
MMDYLAATPVRQLGEIPAGFKSAHLPGGKYAVFTGRGYHEQTQFLVDYVYSTWLPQSEYQRTEGPEFTWLDHSVHPLDPIHSEVQYFLPIR